VKADSVSGSMIVDLDPDGPTDVRLTSVSGEIAIRLPAPADADVEANTASGRIANAFEGLRVHGQWGAHKITGRLGDGTGKLRATTVSGSIALLRRPPKEDEPWEAEAWEEPEPATPTSPTSPTDSTTDPVDSAQDDSGDNSVSGQGDGPTTAPADGTTDKKVL
jgi:hypothetical protein